MDERERALVGGAGFGDAPGAAQQFASCRVQVVEVVQGDPVDDLKARVGAFGLGHCDGPVQLDHGGGGEAGEFTVEGGDLRPVRWLLGVQGCDPRLDGVGAVAVQG